MNDLISIIIPVHNVEKYLQRCLDSVIKQTYHNIEIIIINDFSTDNSTNICQYYYKKDNRIRYYEVKLSSAGKTRNFGLQKAKGKYIIFIDSDDYTERNMIEKLYTTIINNNSDAVFCNFYNSNSIQRKKAFEDIYSIKNYEEQEIKNNIIFKTIHSFREKGDISIYAVWHGIYDTQLIRNNKIEFFDENEYLSEDCIFNFEYLCKCNRITIINDALYNYTINNNSICHTYNKRYEMIDVWYNKILETAEKNKIPQRKIVQFIQERYIDFTVNRIKQEILLSNKKIIYRIKKLKEIVESSRLQEVLKHINYSKRTTKNKILLKLIKHKMIFIIYILISVKN